MFRDRKDAGDQLAEKMSGYTNREDVLVLALPRGGRGKTRIEDKIVLLVDDGIATGATMRDGRRVHLPRNTREFHGSGNALPALRPGE